MAAAGRSVLVSSVADKGMQKRNKAREMDALKEENVRLKRNLARMQQILLLKTQISNLRPAQVEQDGRLSVEALSQPEPLGDHAGQTGSVRPLQTPLRSLDRRAFY